jgi:hypothetical protein
MLCDDWIAMAAPSQAVRTSGPDEALPQLVGFMGAAQRFALAPDAVRGARPLLSFSEIQLAPGAPAATPTGAAIAGCSWRALHHMRVHSRLIPGVVSLVRRHMRGDPQCGMVKQRDIVEAPPAPLKR